MRKSSLIRIVTQNNGIVSSVERTVDQMDERIDNQINVHPIVDQTEDRQDENGQKTGLALIIKGAKMLGWKIYLESANPEDDLRWLALSHPDLNLKIQV